MSGGGTLSDEQFAAFARLLEDTAGLVFDDGRRESLAYSVGERMAAAGVTDAASYLGLVRTPAGSAELQQLLDAVTIQETHFFRNPPQVRALLQHVLPELLRAAAAQQRPLTVWSAGCSTGEEPYTVAMLLRELLPVAPQVPVRVVGTDVSTRALAAAESAVYGERAVHPVDNRFRTRYFVPVQAPTPAYRLREDVRRVVELRHHNLVTDPPPLPAGTVDLLLCRNVTIYFSRQTTQALVQRLHGCLREGGYLFLGHAETLWQVSDAFTLVPLGDAFVYRRVDRAGERRTVLADRRTSPPRPRVAGERRHGGSERRRTTAPVATLVAPSPSVDPLAAARGAVAEGRYDEAVTAAEGALTAAPMDPEAHYLRGLALSNLGRDREALVSLRKAVYLDPGAGLPRFLLAACLGRLGEWAGAARAYRAAAVALQHAPAEVVRADLGGRSPAEAAALAATLAEGAQGRAGQPVQT